MGAAAVVVVAAAAAVSSGVEAFAFPRPQAAGCMLARRGPVAAARRASAIVPRMGTKDDVDSGPKAPSMPFAAAPLQLEKGAAPRARSKPGA
jgi:hypothetical protein